MKKTFLLAACLIMASACSQEQNTSSSDELVEFSLSFAPYVTEPMSRANVSIAELSKRLDVFIVNGADTISVHQNKDSQPDGFGSISATLNKTKNYSLYAVAHKGSGEAILRDGIISFTDNKITDTFYYTASFTPSSSTVLSCVMHRIVGMFKMTIIDELPSNLAKVQFSISGSGLAYNVNGTPTNVGQKVSTINNPSSATDGTTTFKIYCLAPSDVASTVSVTATALDSNDQTIETKTFENVPLRAGYSSAYRGTFFVTTSGEMSFSGDDSWENYDEENF